MANTACSVNIPVISSAFIGKEGIELLSAVKAPRYIDYVNVLFGRVLVKEYLDNESYLSLSDFSKSKRDTTISGALLSLYNKVKDELKEDIDSNLFDTLRPEVVEDLITVWDNWELFVNYHATKHNEFISIDSIENEEEEGEKEKFDKRGNEYNEFELASSEIMTLFKFLPKVEHVTDIHGNTVIREAHDPHTGLPTRANFENVFKLTLDALKGIKNEQEFVDTLVSKDLLKRVPELEYLFKILPVREETEDGVYIGNVDNLQQKQRLLFNSFYTVFSRDYIPVWGSKRTIMENKDNKKVLPEHFRFRAAKGNTRKIESKFISNFRTSLEETEYVKIDDSEDEAHPERAGGGRRRLYSLPSITTLNKGKKIVLTEEELDKITIGEIQEKYKNYFDFFKIIGVEFSDMSLLESISDKTNLIDVLNSALTIHENLSGRLRNKRKIYDPLTDVRKEKFFYMNDENKRVQVPKLTATIKSIVKFEAKFSTLNPTSMSRSMNGNKQSDISYSNVISTAAYQISKSKSLDELYEKSYFKKLKYNPLHIGSFVANNIIGQGKKYLVENYSGHIVKRDEEEIGADTKSLSNVEKFKSDFSNLLGWGIINTPQLEAKSGYFAIKFLDKNDNTILPFEWNNFKSGFLNNTEFLGQVVSYLKGEIQRIKDYSEREKGSYSVPEAYGELHIFKNMFTEKQMTILMNTDFHINSAIIQKVKPKIEKYFQDQFVSLKNFIANNQITDLVTKESLENNKLEVALYEENPELYQDILLRTFIANDFVHNVEFGIFISGDPLFFPDWHKRLGGIASTGTAPANTKNLRKYFDHDSEKRYWRSFSLRGILNQGSEDVADRRDNFDTFLSAVTSEDLVDIKDTVYGNPQTALDYIHSVELKTGKTITLEKAIHDLKLIDKGKSTKIKKGDGQGYLNIDFARELSIRQNTYKPQHDVSYMFEALVFKKDILGKELKPGELVLYNKLQNQIINNPKKYALPILKQTYYGTLGNEDVKLDAKVYDKFSLSILLPTVAKNHPQLKKLLVAMATRQMGYVKYESGTKGYIRNKLKVDDLFNPKVELDILQSDLLKLQIVPAETEKTETKIPTQMIKLIYTNLFDRGNASESVQKLRGMFLSNLNKIQSSNKEAILHKLGFKVDEQGKIESWDKKKIIENIITQIKVQKLPSNILEALELDATGGFVNTLESSGIYQQMLNYVSGKLDANLREFKVNGGDFVLLSDSMFETPLKYLKMSRDKSTIESMEVRITLTEEFSKLLNIPDPSNTTKNIGTIERLNELLQNKNFVKEHEKELTIAFSRPPVQGPNSMGVAIIKEFFYPTAGNVMVLPVEFMHQAGIDFDYDKEKVLLPSLSNEGIFLDDVNIAKRLAQLENEYKRLREIFDYVDEYLEETDDYKDYDDLRNNLLGGDTYTRFLLSVFGVSEPEYIPEDLEKLAPIADEYLKLKYRNRSIYNNNLLKTIINSLKQPEIYSELILPNTNETAIRLALNNGKDINNLNTLPIGNSVYTYEENLKVFRMFNEAKDLLGSFALQNTFSQLIAPLDIKLNLDYAINEEDIPKRRVNNLLLKNKSRVIDISVREDENGDNKQHLNSEFINATVDSAKDPYFANFMLSRGNINTFMFMFTMNYPVETIIDFTSSALVRKYLDTKKRYPGVPAADIFLQTLKENGWTSSTKSLSKEQILAFDVANIGKTIKDLKKLKKNSTIEDKDKYGDDHVALLINFFAMEEHARQLSSFKGLFKNDTDKITSIFEIFSKENQKRDVIKAGMFSKEDIEKVENQSTMSAFKNEELIKNILEEIFPIVSHPKVVQVLGDLFVERKLSLKDNEKRVLSQVITNDFIGSILFSFGSYKDRNIFDYAQDLIRKKKNKDKTFNTVLLERIQALRQNDEYQDLIDQFSVLTKIVGDPSPKPIKRNPVYENKYGLNVQFDVDANMPISEKEGYMTQFKQIIEGDFNSPIKDELIDIIKDFFIAGLIQSGLNKTATSHIEYIPVKFIQDLLKPALYYYNFEKNDEDQDTFDIFLKRFAYNFKMNNSRYFTIDKEDKKNTVKDSHLGKFLKVINYDTSIEEEIVEEPEVKTTVKIVKSPWEAQKAGEGISVIRGVEGSTSHYGNPFTHLKSDQTKHTLIKVATIAKAVQAFKDWLSGTKYQEVEPKRRQWILDNINDGFLDGKTLLYYKDIGQESHADALAEIVNNRTKKSKVEVVQPGFGVYKNALTQEEHDTILKYALDQLATQGYHVKKAVAYAHWGKMWAVNDRGAEGFPVFGKYLRKDASGKIDLQIAPITSAESVDSPNAKGWYNYYETDQNGNPLAEIPQEIKDIVKKATGYDITDHDAAIINAYADGTVLTRHIDNTEDTTARNKGIVSISLLNPGKFYFGEGSKNSTNQNPDNKEITLNPRDVAIFGNESRFMPHRVDVGKGNTTHVDLSDGTSGIEARRINITIRRVMPVNKVPTQIVDTPQSRFTDHSGGAIGSDYNGWDQIGRKFGFNNHKHYWYNEKTPYGNTEISKEDAEEGQKKATVAARQMGRIEPTHQIRDNRIIRNWAQVKYAKSIFAVTTFLGVGDTMNHGKKAKIIQGAGGTGYAIQMAINEGKSVFVFDQIKNAWASNINGEWKRMNQAPILTEDYAGIGTREINARGLKAIEQVFKNTLKSITKNKLTEKEQKDLDELGFKDGQC